jgi:hypothetical protein
VPSIANRLWEWITARILVLAGQFCNLQSSSAILFGIYAGRVDVGYRDVSTVTKKRLSRHYNRVHYRFGAGISFRLS